MILHVQNRPIDYLLIFFYQLEKYLQFTALYKFSGCIQDEI